MEKKWPISAQILIGLGCIGGVRGLIVLITTPHDLLIGIPGVISLVIWWSLYKFQSWAIFALTLLLSISILMAIFTLFQGMPALVFGIISIVFQGLVIWYFNRPAIRSLTE